MSDTKALEAQIDRLLAGSFALVESNRLLSSSVAVVSAQVGRLCDEMREFAERSDSRHSDSERNIRLLQTDGVAVKKRLEKVERALGLAEASGAKTDAR